MRRGDSTNAREWNCVIGYRVYGLRQWLNNLPPLAIPILAILLKPSPIVHQKPPFDLGPSVPDPECGFPQHGGVARCTLYLNLGGRQD